MADENAATSPEEESHGSAWSLLNRAQLCAKRTLFKLSWKHLPAMIYRVAGHTFHQRRKEQDSSCTAIQADLLAKDQSSWQTEIQWRL